VVTAEGRLAGPGEEGQLHVGGPVVSSGYLVEGRLDRSRFVADVWGGTGELLPTGDFARVDADGVTVTYAGRADDFVKVRGYRVSPGEVEAALARHPEVTSVVVVAAERTAGVSSLSAFVVARAGSGLAEPALRAFLDGELPRHLLPDRIVCLDALPRLPNGKVDRGRLLALPVDGSGYTAPRDDFEASICALWQEILGVERVGIHDKFRDLGGDSLGAVELAFQLDEMLDTELPSEIFSNAATVAELAAACREFLSRDQ
jgi:acyl carrier protein